MVVPRDGKAQTVQLVRWDKVVGVKLESCSPRSFVKLSPYASMLHPQGSNREQHVRPQPGSGKCFYISQILLLYNGEQILLQKRIIKLTKNQ